MSKRDELEKAIASLESQRSILGDTAVDAAVAGIKAQLAALEPAEKPPDQRKQVTILFTDVVGSTNIGERLDPEELLELFNNSLRTSGEIVEAYKGKVGRFMGDGMLAFFGAEQTREDDPEQAVRAGLAIVAAAEAYAQEVQERWQIDNFKVRVGINTGLVVMAEVGGSGKPDYTAMGDTTNLASRLESAAPEGTVLISHNTYRHVRGIFDVEPLDLLTVKGKSEPVQVYVVEGVKPRAFHMRTRGVEGIETKTIGRDNELTRLQQAYQTATGRGETTVITVVGDAGVGKSRLLQEFEEWIDLRPELIRYFKGRAFEQFQGSPHHLLRDMLETRFQILESDPLTTIRRKFVDDVVEFLPDEGEMKAHVLGKWLGYDFGDSSHLQPIKDDPEQIKNRATLYLAQFFTAIGEIQPVVILLEDIHWADGGSLDEVIDLVRRRPHLPLLIVCLARPSLYERRPGWEEELGGAARLDLAPLSGEDTRALVAEILRLVDPLPQLLLDLVSNRAEGNPFYAEELIKMLIDDGIIVAQGEQWQVMVEQLLELDAPSTLTGVLQARLDRLTLEEKNAVQQASVIGRTFWDKALAELPAGGDLALPSLQAKEFVFSQPGTAFAGTAEYLFKHALLRDVVYETVLKRLRRGYHGLVADWLVATAEANERADEYAALIAEHYQLANNVKHAAVWYGRAGHQAAATYSHEEAIRYLSLAFQLTPDDDISTRFTLLQAREKVHHIQGDREAQSADLDALTSLANELNPTDQATIALRRTNHAISTSDYSAATIMAKEAIELAQTADASSLVSEGYELWGYSLWRLGQFQEATDQLNVGLTLAEEIGNKKGIANCLNSLGNVSGVMGDDAGARQQFGQALSIWRELGDRRGEGAGLNNLGVVAGNLGDYEQAQANHEQSLAIKREIGDRQGEASSLLNLGSLAINEGDYERARRYYEQALAIQREVGDRQGEGISLTGLGVVANERGAPAEARDYHEQSLAVKRDVGDRLGEVASLYNLGAVAMNQEDHDTAKEYLERSLAISNEIGNRFVAGVNLNELGALALAQKDIPLAESHYQEALDIRRELNQPNLCAEDRAGLAQVKLAQGDRKGAQQYGEKVLEYLKENPRLDGAENRLRAFRFTWEVLLALGQSSDADEVLSLAAKILGECLVKNGDPDSQELYLRQPHHRVLWEAWEQKGNVRS